MTYAAEALFLFVVLGIFRLLPIDMASMVGGLIGRWVGPHLNISRRALKNLSFAFPENTEELNQRILLGMWDNLGRTAAEYPHLRRICLPSSGRVEIINGSIISTLADDDKPGILIGGHFANWEIGPYILPRVFKLPLASVYRTLNNPWVDTIIRRLRHAPLEIAKGGDGSRELLRTLRQGGHVGILIDQKLNDGIAVPFFGYEAMTAPGAARLALRFKCPLVPLVAERLKGAYFRITAYSPIDVSATEDNASDVLRIMSSVNRMLEDWIRKNPDQWLWVHKRWPH